MTTLPDLLRRALSHHQAGQLAQAEQLYREILQLDPRHADACHLLGVIAYQTGHHEHAQTIILQAITLNPNQASYHFNLGEVHRAQGQHPEAEACYRQALRLQPEHATAHNNLGTLLQARDALAEAESCYRQAVRCRADYAIAHNNLGAVLLARGALTEAHERFTQALRLQPGYAEAHNNLGTLWHRLGDLQRAQACFEQALRLKPEHANAHHNLGLVLHTTGRLPEAVACFKQALRLRPDFADAHLNLAAVLKDTMQFSEAQTCLEQALRIRPNYVEALQLLATVLEFQGKPAEAIAAVERALAVKPNPELKLRSALVFPVVYESVEEVQRYRQRVESAIAELSTQDLSISDPVHTIGATTFFLAYQGKNDRDVQASLASLSARAAPELNYVALHCRSGRVGERSTGLFRIGIISNYFYYHTIGKLNLGFVRKLDRQKCRVILFRFPGHDDHFAQMLSQSADETVTLPRKLEAAQEQIARQELDVLFYTDIGMDPFTYFLAFARLAPIQCVTWGHPVTTGISTIDYFLSAEHLEPSDAAEHYTEQLIRMQLVNSYYYHPQMPSPAKTRKDLGLADDVHLYVCPQSLYKFHPEFDLLLGEILRGDPRGQLVLIEGIHPHWRELLTRRFQHTLGDVIDRIQFLPRLSSDDFLHLQVLADVLLDTIHFGGGNTSYEALAFGTPIVTLPGPLLRSRITYACYRQMGVTECVASSPEDYVRIALRLGTDPAWRQQIKAAILAARDVLYENTAAIRELEQFFIEAVARVRS